MRALAATAQLWKQAQGVLWRDGPREWEELSQEERATLLCSIQALRIALLCSEITNEAIARQLLAAGPQPVPRSDEQPPRC